MDYLRPHSGDYMHGLWPSSRDTPREKALKEEGRHLRDRLIMLEAMLRSGKPESCAFDTLTEELERTRLRLAEIYEALPAAPPWST